MVKQYVECDLCGSKIGDVDVEEDYENVFFLGRSVLEQPPYISFRIEAHGKLIPKFNNVKVQICFDCIRGIIMEFGVGKKEMFKDEN